MSIAEDRSQSVFVNTDLQDSRRLLGPSSPTSQGHTPNLAVGALQGALEFKDMVLLYVLQDLISMNTSSFLQRFKPKLNAEFCQYLFSVGRFLHTIDF